MTEKINYNFETETDSDYKLEFKLTTKAALLLKIFNISIKALIAQGKEELKNADITKITKFDVMPKFYNLIRTALKKQIRQVENEVSKDGIDVLNGSVNKCTFEKKGDNWEIYVKIVGQYAKKF